jgi:rfaE bifunctional protein nucleotidyltransferase chain/domain
MDSMEAVAVADLPGNRSRRNKVRSVAELAALAEHHRANGGTVVLAHGTFDLLHMGHVRHLEGARQEGTMLLVTLTADRHVNKGPGRPVFTEALRAEMLAALECVDGVAISQQPTSVEVLLTVKPSVYVKGSDYVDENGDVTGGIRLEREAVESVGGRLVFTDDITFSSSSLINRHLNVFPPALRSYLDGQRERDLLGSLSQLIDKVKDYKVLLVGDTIIDQYDYVHPLGKPPKENLIATQFQGSDVFAGGIIAAANHVASFCAEVEIVTVLGEQDSHLDLIRRSLKPNVRLTQIMVPGRPTTRKLRYVEASYKRKLFEVYFMDDAPLDAHTQRLMIDAVRSRTAEADVTIATDFGHGAIGPEMVDTLVRHARFLAVNTQTNSANAGYNLITKYPRADYLCIDAPEARLALSDRQSSMEHIAGVTLPGRIDCDRLIVTTGREGCVSYDRAAGTARIPAFTNTVVDTVGAGDAFLAVTAPLAAAGGDMEQIGFIGNAAGAIKVGILGHQRSVEKIPVLKYLTTLLK